MSEQAEQIAEYRCPGQQYAISRAVHLGRMANFYPGCRQCEHRHQTGGLSPRQRKQLAETERRRPRSLFNDEGAGGVYLNDLGPDEARRLAAAMGVWLKRNSGDDRSADDEMPVVTLAGDGRAIGCELIAAVAEGLRWSGCHLVDVGPATAACLAFAVDHLGASGAVLVGNPSGRPQTVGLKFWMPAARPVSSGTRLASLEQYYGDGFDRPTRTYGSLRRFSAELPYLARLAEHYHALRRLRFVLDTSCDSVSRYVAKLTESIACESIPARFGAARLAEQVREDRAHFASRIDDDGEICHFLDQRGRPVPAERLLMLLAGHLLALGSQYVVLEKETSAAVAARLKALGARLIVSGARRSQMEQSMRDAQAIFGGGPSGRFWYDFGGIALSDGLMTLTLLLKLLSRSDRQLSEVLDREAVLS